MTDPSDVITTDLITSLHAALNKPDAALKKLETRGGHTLWFKKAHADAVKTKETLAARVEKLRPGIGRVSRKDPAITGLIKTVSEYVKKVEAAAKQEPFMTFRYGGSTVASKAALVGKIRAVLPTAAAKGEAGTSLDRAVSNDTHVKDAAKAGAGVKHCSAGKSGVKASSCTLFFTRTSEQDGLETVLDIVGVGSHETSTTYLIHDSFTSKLKKGAVFAV